MRTTRPWLAILGSLLILAGCGGDDDADDILPTYRSGASPSLGLIRNATVNFYRNDNSTQRAKME